MAARAPVVATAEAVRWSKTMSATNRGGKREASDYYRTPQWAILQMLEAVTEDSASELGDDFTARSLSILDPCAGGDERNGMAYPDAISAFKKWRVGQLDTIDIRNDSRASIKADYLTYQCGGLDVVMTNPPFCDALKIIQKALGDCSLNGTVIMLQRLNFFGSKDRSEWFKNHMPVLTYVHAKRMQFSDVGGSDSIEYAHFVWRKNLYPKFTKLRVLPAP